MVVGLLCSLTCPNNTQTNTKTLSLNPSTKQWMRYEACHSARIVTKSLPPGSCCSDISRAAIAQSGTDPVQSPLDRPPLFHEAPIQDCIRVHSDNAVYRLPHKHRYRQYCMVCGQWIASPKVMKLHYRQSHSDLTHHHSQQATALCQLYTAGGSPCTYCGAQLAQPKTHKLVCPVLWQFCLSLAQLRHDTGRSRCRLGCGGSLRQPSQGQCKELCGSTHGTGIRTPSQGCQTGTRQTRQALRQLTRRWPQQPGTRIEGSRQGEQNLATADNSGQGYGKARDSPGDPTSDPQAEFCMVGLLATGDQRPHAGALSCGRAVQRAGQGEVHGSAGSGSVPEHLVSHSVALPSCSEWRRSPAADCSKQPGPRFLTRSSSV